MKKLDKNAWEALLKLAENGDRNSQFEVALYFDNGFEDIVEQDMSKAFEWYYRAHQNGDISSTIRVADFLSEGLCCEKNLELAIKLYNIGIANGSGVASANLATIYRDSHDYTKMFELYKKTQELDKTGCLRLGLCYYYGVGTEEDKRKAFEIFLEISNDVSEGDNCQYDIDEANFYLGKIYLNGEVVERSIDKARYYLNLANTNNDHSSANELLLIIGRAE